MPNRSEFWGTPNRLGFELVTVTSSNNATVSKSGSYGSNTGNRYQFGAKRFGVKTEDRIQFWSTDQGPLMPLNQGVQLLHGFVKLNTVFSLRRKQKR
jgi:hypothetical protein